MVWSGRFWLLHLFLLPFALFLLRFFLLLRLGVVAVVSLRWKTRRTETKGWTPASGSSGEHAQRGTCLSSSSSPSPCLQMFGTWTPTQLWTSSLTCSILSPPRCRHCPIWPLQTEAGGWKDSNEGQSYTRRRKRSFKLKSLFGVNHLSSCFLFPSPHLSGTLRPVLSFYPCPCPSPLTWTSSLFRQNLCPLRSAQQEKCQGMMHWLQCDVKLNI